MQNQSNMLRAEGGRGGGVLSGNLSGVVQMMLLKSSILLEDLSRHFVIPGTKRNGTK